MKVLLVGLALCAVAIARPQDGQFTREAIQQAQSQNLIPRDAHIESVSDF